MGIFTIGETPLTSWSNRRWQKRPERSA